LEHAILLCNYFAQIEMAQNQSESFVVLGNSIFGNFITKGKCAYVLRKHKLVNKFELWDPKSGDPYFYDMKVFSTNFMCIQISQKYKQQVSVQNQVCPLTSVGTRSILV
jgi:hypothetical protein